MSYKGLKIVAFYGYFRTEAMSNSLSERYSDAVARIHARRRLRARNRGSSPNSQRSGIEVVGDSISNSEGVDSSKKNEVGTSSSIVTHFRDPVQLETDKSWNPRPSPDTARGKSLLAKSPLHFPSVATSSHLSKDHALFNTIKRHQEVLALITAGTEMLVQVSILNEESIEFKEKDAIKFPDTAVRASVYCTPDLRNLVWEKLGSPGINSIPISDIAAIVCVFASDLEDTLLPHEAPILRVMIRGENSAMDFVCSDINCRVAWAQGLSLAYGLQTCAMVGNGSNN